LQILKNAVPKLAFNYCILLFGGQAVAQLVEALCYKPEVRVEYVAFFNLPSPSTLAMALGSTLSQNRNEYQESSLG
jgi:hypothetical protein